MVVLDFGCAVHGCTGHATPEAAYQHWTRTRPEPDDAAVDDAVREDEAAASWDPDAA